jgi:hypothetical protein
MTGFRGSWKLLVVVLVGVTAFGCVSPAPPSPTETTELDRWLSESPLEREESAIPERDATPPRTVELESLEASVAPPAAEGDLPQPEYFSFTIPQPAYVSVSADSDAGAEIYLIDRSEGVIGQSGQAGIYDGRIDMLLDAGEYRVSVRTAFENDAARLSVNRFTEIETDSELLMSSAPGTLHQMTLNDFEQRSYWIRVTEEDPLLLEAMGRSLRDVRIWKDGVWVIERQPSVGSYSAVSGQSMGYVQAHFELEPGDYLVTFYGGARRSWEEESGENPFYVRRGARYLGSIVDAQTQISPMGRDAFVVSGDITVMEIENPDFVPAQMGISYYGDGQDRYRATNSIAIRESDESTRSRGMVSRSSDVRWLYVSGTPGDTVRIRAIPRRTEYRIDEPTAWSQYLISTISTLDSDHAIDATPIITRDRTAESPEEVIQSEALQVSTDTPIYREINLSQPAYFIADIDRAGRWAIVHDRGENSPVAIAMIPLRDINDIRVPDIVTSNPAGFDLEPGLHMVMLQPSSPGILRFVLYFQGSVSVMSDRRAAAMLSEQAPLPRGDVTYITEGGEIASGRTHTVVINERGGPTSALFVERLPLSMEEPVPFTLAPGEELAVQVYPRTGGSLSTGYSTIEVRRNGEVIPDGGSLPAGRSTLTLANNGSSTTTFILSLEEDFISRYAAPTIPPLEETYPILNAGGAVYHDYRRGQSRQFLLIVDAPAFYELQTTGRLATRLSVRTQVNPRGASTSSNGPGRNALIQSYFRPGTYLVDVGPTGNSEGRAGLVMTPLPLVDLGVLSEGVPYRSELEPGVGLLARAAVTEPGDFSFRTIGLYGSPTTRLEDADSWPVQTTTLGAGVYRYYSWPQTVWNRRLTSYDRIPDPVEYGDGEPWPLEVNGSYRRLWNETAGREPHQYVVALPATIPVSLRTASAMEWWITDADGSLIAEGSGNEDLELPSGSLTISIRTREENNNYSYEIALSTDVLADGIDQRVSRVPTDMPVVVEDSGIYELWSTGTWDLRADLATESDIVVASGDDRPGDWNFHLSRYLPAGTYELHVSESFPGSGSVTVHCQRRDEVRVGTQELPFDTRLQLDQTIIGIPFRSRRAGAVNIVADSSAAHLALYRGETLLAEGSSQLFVPLPADQEYLLRIRNESLNDSGVGLTIDPVDAVSITWDSASQLVIPPGAARIENDASVAVIVSSDGAAPLLSGATERAAREVGDGVLANPGGIIWSWNDGENPASARPLTVEPGRTRTFNMTDDDVALRLEGAPNRVRIIEIRTMAGYLGASQGPFPSTSAIRDWSAADMIRSSTVLGVVGEEVSQIWIWDGEPGAAGRRVEIGVAEFALVGERRLGLGDVMTLAPGEVVVIDSEGVSGIQLLLSPDMVAFASHAGTTTATVAARRDNRSAWLPGGRPIYVVNRGNEDRVARAQSTGNRELLTVSSTRLAETLLAAEGVVTMRIGSDPPEEAALCAWAVDPSVVVLLTDSGRRIPARSPSAERPYWTLPAVAGVLQIEAEAGPVAAWLGSEPEAGAAWATNSGRAVELTEGANPMSWSAQRWEFELDHETFVILGTENRGFMLLDPGGEQADLSPQIAIGSGTTRRVLAVLGIGTHSVITRPIAGEPQPDPLWFQTMDPVVISELIDPEPFFLGAGERAVFEFTVVTDGAVGVGLQAETDDFTTYLMDDQLNVVGSGRIYYRELVAGRYFFLVENGGRPMNVEPVILADQGSRTGVPEDVIESYRGE